MIGYDHVPIPHLVINSGTTALGDSIARLQVIPEVFKEAPHVRRIHVLVAPYLLDFAAQLFANLYPITLHPIGKQLPSFLDGAPGINLGTDTVTTLRMPLIDHAYIHLIQRLPREELKYTQVAPITVQLPAAYYVVGTLDYTAQVRAMPLQVFEKIASDLHVPIVLLGNSKNVELTEQPRINHSNVIDMRDKTTISEAHAYIHNAKAIFGIDNGLLHLAATTATPIIAGFTTVSPEARIPKRLNGPITALTPASSVCRFCQSDSHYVYGNDYRNCFKYTKDCIKDLTANRWLAELTKYLPFDHRPILQGGTHD
jgi:hypothetical protein